MFKVYTSAFIVNENDEILLVTEKKEANYNKLNFPGGHLEEGETPMQGAIRETLEETGLNIELLGLIRIFLGRNHPSFHYIFAGKVVGGELLELPTEVLKVGWYSWGELCSMPKEAFVYREKVEDIWQKFRAQQLIPIEDIICDLKKI